MSSAVVIDAIRTPIGRADGRAGCFRDVRADELSAGLITELVARTAIDPALIEDVRWGCVQQQGEQGYDIARIAVLMAGPILGEYPNAWEIFGIVAAASGVYLVTGARLRSA